VTATATRQLSTLARWQQPLLRCRWAAILAIAAADAWATRNDSPADLAQFAQLGNEVVTGHPAAVYATAWNQAGPLQLLGSRVLMIGGGQGRPALAAIVVVNLAIVLLLRAAFRARPGPPRPAVELLAGALTVLWLAPGGLWDAHPVEIVIPMLWLVAGAWLQRGRLVAAGVLLGLAAAIAPWAILAVPMTLLTGNPKRAARPALVAVAVAVLAYLPFALSGHFQLFDHIWPVGSHSLVHLLLPHLIRFSWFLRLLQAGLAAGACGAIAYRRRGLADVAWVAPLSAVVVRIATDPVARDYYWLPAGVLVIGGLATAAAGSRTRAQLAGIAVLAYLTYGALVSTSIALVACVGCLIGVALILTGKHAAGERE